MPQAEHYEKEVATVPAGATCREMAEKMKADATGCLVVLEAGRPVGVVTDRDLLCRVIGEDRDAGTTVARDVMSQPLVGVSPADPLEEYPDYRDELGQLAPLPASDGQRRIPEEGFYTGSGE